MVDGGSDKKKRVAVTVDVEALPKRAPSRHVERLIWGRHSNGDAGLREILALAEHHGIAVTCFLDLCEHELYGQELLDPAQYIRSAGHDLQLHCHPEILPAHFWQRRGFQPPRHLQDRYDEQAVQAFLPYFTQLFRDQLGIAPMAYRAGSFRFNEHVLNALIAEGFHLSSNDCFETSRSADHHTFGTVGLDMYRWSNGLLEIPVTEMKHGDGYTILSFPRRIPFANFGAFLDAFFDGPEAPQLATVLLHSWSLLQKNEEGHYVFKDSKRYEALWRFFEHIGRHYEPVTMRDLAKARERGEELTRRELNVGATATSVARSKPLDGCA